jgi:hypothetical protein
MDDNVAQISVTRPRTSSDWILDAQRRRDAGEGVPQRPWSSLPAARLAAFCAFDDAFPCPAARPDALRTGGTWLAQVGEAFSPAPELRRALRELRDAAAALTPLLGRIELAAEALHPLARTDNSVRDRLSGTWLLLAGRARWLVGEANVLPGAIDEALDALGAAPMLPGITAPVKRSITTTACARLVALAREVAPLGTLLGSATLMLLEIAFEVDEPFDEPSGEYDEGSDGTYKKRLRRWDKAWIEANAASAR